MYSYEDRIRAVKLFIKLGNRPRATIRQLGYPTKNALIGWYRAYIQDCDLQEGYVRSIRKYSDDQKQAAVQHFLDTTVASRPPSEPRGIRVEQHSPIGLRNCTRMSVNPLWAEFRMFSTLRS